jgi:RNA polymerase sigma-70 factor, ECF subfamily
VIFSFDSRRRAHYHHVTKFSSPQLLYFPHLQNYAARNRFRPLLLRVSFARRIRPYENDRVGSSFSNSFRIPTLCGPYLFSFQLLAHSFGLARNSTLLFSVASALFAKNHPGWGVPASSAKGFSPTRPLRLFGSLHRIPVRMSATISCLTTQRTSFFAASAAPGPTLFFSTLMGDEAKSIARGLQKRDPDLLDRLIEQYQYRLFRYLVYVTGNKERAEDFFQETWIRVLERGHQYDGKSKFEAWLFAIARHLVIDWQRSKKTHSLDTLTDPEQERPLQLANESEPSPLHQVLSQEAEENVQASLQKIPAIYREVLVLRFQEELQIDEMAGVLSVPLSTVKSRLYRGLEALRGALQGGAA